MRKQKNHIPAGAENRKGLSEKMKTPHWLIRAYTNADKKHCFSRVIVSAFSRKDAIEKALHFSGEKRKETAWTAGPGHVITACPYPSN